MKITTLPFLAVATLIAASSCSSAYKTAQTPDDVYYSPAGQKTRTVSSDDSPEYYSTNPNDQYIQLKSEDQARWSYFDDYNYYDSYYCSPVGYYGSTYGYYGAGLGFGFGSNPFLNPTSYWSSYYAWNSFYNPYFYNPYYGGGMILVNPKYANVYGGYPAGYPGTGYTPYTTAYSGLRTFSPASYRPLRINSTNSNNGNRYYTPGASRSNNSSNSFYRGGNQNNTNSTNNNFNRTNNNTNYQQPSQPVRTFTPSSSGGGGSGGGVSRPGRF